VIDNFLDEKYFDNLVTLFTDKEEIGNTVLPWYLACGRAVTFSKNSAEFRPSNTDKLFYMYHMLYNHYVPQSPHYNSLIPLLEKLEVDSLLRIKANLFPSTEILHEHQPHPDYNFSHSGALLSLNTCDGYTKLKDGTKVNSVANRILIFDAGEEHQATTTTNDFARINININYLRLRRLL